MISRCIGPTSASESAGITIGASPRMACSTRKRLRLTDITVLPTPLYPLPCIRRQINARFTRELQRQREIRMRKEAINHDACAFTENKRYRTKPPRVADVVIQNA